MSDPAVLRTGLPSPTSSVSQNLCTATGSTTARSMAARAADVVNVKDHGATGDGTDETTEIVAAYTALSRGGVLYFPGGTYKFNLIVDKDGVQIVGGGKGSANANATPTLAPTVFTPADTTAPVLTLGAGTTRRQGIGVRDVTLVGDAGLTATSDAILVQGATQTSIRDVMISSFGRHGIRLESTATQATFGIFVDGVTIASVRGAGISASYGSQFVTAINISNTHIIGYNGAGSYALRSDGVAMNLANLYMDIGGDSQGHVRLDKTGGYPNPYLVCQGVNFDNAAGASAVAIEIPWATATSPVQAYVQGSYVVNGVARMGGATNHPQAGKGWGGFQAPWMLWPMAFSALGFPYDEAGASAGTTDVYLERVGAAGAATLQVNGANLLLNKTSPLIAGNVANESIFLRGTRDAADSGTDAAIGSSNTRTAGNLASVQNAGVNVLNFGFSGKLGLTGQSFTDDSATTGNRTVNKPYGRNAFAGGATSVTITNNLVSAASLVFVALQTNDGTARLANVVPASGSFAVNLTAAATGTTIFAWMVIN
jgi:hypothetical protein